MLSLGSAACICRHYRYVYKHYRLPVLEARHIYYCIYIYVCTQVIDKRRRQSEREGENYLLFSVIAYTINERRTRAETDRFRYLYME